MTVSEALDGCDDCLRFVVSADLEYCGRVPLNITRQPASVRYLSECKWGPSTSSESIAYYGRDVDVTLTCWADGSVVMDDPYWYKVCRRSISSCPYPRLTRHKQTTDNCHVSGSGLWEKPGKAAFIGRRPRA